jgi:RHS repeat-associated protein
MSSRSTTPWAVESQGGRNSHRGHQLFQRIHTEVSGTPSPRWHWGIGPLGSETASESTYTWNDDDRLIGIQFPGGATNAYTYDANGIRTSKNDSTGNVRYLIDPSRQSTLAAYDAVTKARLTIYTQNPAKIDEIVSYKTSGGTKYYPHADMLGSVHAVSDSTGTTLATWVYDVYGTRTQVSGTLLCPFGFTGREHDGDSGLIYFRDRYHDAAIGSWTQPDRLPLPSNRYRAMGDAPTAYTDPSGFWPFYASWGNDREVTQLLEVQYQSYNASVPYSDCRHAIEYFWDALEFGDDFLAATLGMWNFAEQHMRDLSSFGFKHKYRDPDGADQIHHFLMSISWEFWFQVRTSPTSLGFSGDFLAGELLDAAADLLGDEEYWEAAMGRSNGGHRLEVEDIAINYDVTPVALMMVVEPQKGAGPIAEFAHSILCVNDSCH